MHNWGNLGTKISHLVTVTSSRKSSQQNTTKIDDTYNIDIMDDKIKNQLLFDGSFFIGSQQLSV